MSIAILQVVPAVSGGRALHRVSARADSQPGDDTLTARMQKISVSEYKSLVPQCKDTCSISVSGYQEILA
jgi:hypothetical protein